MATNPSSNPPPEQENLIFKISIKDISNPSITRTLSCPADSTFHKFHQALIISFGWALTHEYNFQIFDETASADSRFYAPRPCAHFSEWEPENFPLIGIPNPPKPAWRHSTRITIHQFMDMPAYQGKQLQYEYDFGDGWEHEIILIGRAPRTEKFVCIDGEGRGAAEDVGGPFGWEELKEAYRTENPDQRQKDKRWWYERFCTNGYNSGLGGDKAWRWNLEEVNEQLKRLPRFVWNHDRMVEVCKCS